MEYNKKTIFIFLHVNIRYCASQVLAYIIYRIYIESTQTIPRALSYTYRLVRSQARGRGRDWWTRTCLSICSIQRCPTSRHCRDLHTSGSSSAVSIYKSCRKMNFPGWSDESRRKAFLRPRGRPRVVQELS